MKTFSKREPSEVVRVGNRYKKTIVIKQFQTDDGLSHEFTTFCGEGSRGGAVIALTPEKQVVVMYEFRAGPERWMCEIPGGGINEGEDAQAGAIRELAEETGYCPGEIEFLGSCHGDAYTNFERFYFLATNCTPGEKRLDDEEAEQGAEVRLIPIDELIRNAQTDQMTDPAAVLMAYEKLKALQGKK